MDTSLSFFSLSFGDSETPEICYNVKNVIASQDSVDNDLNQPQRPPSALLQPYDVLEELLSMAGAQHIDEAALNNVQTLYCEICGKTFDKIMKYYGHLRVHSKDNVWHCDKCPGVKFATKQQLMKHALEHNPLPKAFRCSQCPMAFDASLRLNQHILAKHISYRTHKCDECNKLFMKASDLKKHKYTHSDVQKYDCPHCAMKFKDKSNLKRHILSHTGEKPYVCSGCGHRFQQLASLKRHTQKCTLHIIKNPSMDSQDTQSQLRQSHCRVCGMKFQYKSALLEHCVREHTNPKADKPAPTITDVGKTVDALVDDILSVEDDYSILNANNVLDDPNEILDIAGFEQNQEMDNHADSLMQIEFLKEMNQLHSLDDELFYNDLDFDGFQSSQVFDLNGTDYDFSTGVDSNTEIFFDIGDNGKSIDQDLMNNLYQVKGGSLPDDLLNIPEPIVSEVKNLEHEDTNKSVPVESAVSVNDCATIFESDVDLEASSCLAANLNLLIGENNVQYISTEDDDTFIISLNSAIDAEQLTDMLNIGLGGGVEETVSKTEAEKENVVKKEEQMPEVSKETTVKSNADAKKKKKFKLKVMFVCKVCKKIFKKKDTYTSHLATHEPSLRRHKCPVCGERFSYRSTLNKHTAALHTPRVLPQHVCNMCHKQYKAAWQLKNHQERDHDGLTPFYCEIEGCNKGFYKQFDLVVHQRYHNGDRPYICSICSRGFADASHLRRHMRHVDCTKHGKNDLISKKKSLDCDKVNVIHYSTYIR